MKTENGILRENHKKTTYIYLFLKFFFFCEKFKTSSSSNILFNLMLDKFQKIIGKLGGHNGKFDRR